MFVCEYNMCAGCMACIEVCSQKAIHIEDSLKAYNAVIDTAKCIRCNVCREVCQFNNDIEYKYPIRWQQGWIKEESIRGKSSSGGAAAAFSRFFVKNGGIVCSCVFSNGEFGFEFAQTENELDKFKGSKYVKSNPLGIYKKIKEKLTKNNVLFIGLPCQVAALKNFVGSKLTDKLYTVDLICHGTPSPKILENFLNDYGYFLNTITDIKFRKKNRFGLYNDYKKVAFDNGPDTYTKAFLSSLDYTENCYYCKYAKIERVSDITIGDSWGSLLSAEEGNGISLILCQTDKGKWLVDNSGLHTENVDLERAILYNNQLKQPSSIPEKREKFMSMLQKGASFNRAFANCYPKLYYRQKLKELFIRLGLKSKGGVLK